MTFNDLFYDGPIQVFAKDKDCSKETLWTCYEIDDFKLTKLVKAVSSDDGYTIYFDIEKNTLQDCYKGSDSWDDALESAITHALNMSKNIQ